MTPEHELQVLKGQCDIIAKQLKVQPIYTKEWLDKAKAKMCEGLFK